jgi:hypothetical protein
LRLRDPSNRSFAVLRTIARCAGNQLLAVDLGFALQFLHQL